MPNTEENKKIVQEWYDRYNQGDVDGLLQLHAEEIVARPVNSPVPEQHAMRGKHAGRELFAKHREAFPDWREEIHFMVAEGDKVAVYHTGKGTQQGEFAGRGPSHREVTVTALDVVRIADDGKVVEHWGVHPWQEPVAR